MKAAAPEHVFLKGFGLANYRSFGPRMQFLNPHSKLNVLVGKNNIGKSNVLRAIELLAIASANRPFPFNTFEDSHKGQLPKFAIPFELLTPPGSRPVSNHYHYVEDSVGEAWLRDEAENFLCVLAGKPTDGGRLNLDVCSETTNEIAAKLQSKGIAPNHLSEYCLESFGQSSSDLSSNLQAWARRIRTAHFKPLPKIRMVQAIRNLNLPAVAKRQGLDALTSFDGSEVVAHLFEIQEPKSEHQEEHGKLFLKFTRFVRDVLEEEDCDVRVAHDKQEVKVRIKGRTLPLQNLGTGLHQLILLAAAATHYQHEIILIEEPETNIHPSLQRKFLRYLLDSTENQYFITTHAPAIIDFPEAHLFHCTGAEDGTTSVTRVEKPHQRHAALTELDYRASDLLQSNCILWVEGPSDRIYINGLIALSDDRLCEGTHYSVLFYGGSSLSHFSSLDSTDTQLSDLISAVRINRNSQFICDSDKGATNDKLKPAVVRMLAEFRDIPERIWVTSGREFENYIPQEYLKAAFDRVHTRSQYQPPSDTIFGDVTKRASGKDFDKVLVAQRCVNELRKIPDVLDLRERVAALVGWIRACNGMKS